MAALLIVSLTARLTARGLPLPTTIRSAPISSLKPTSSYGGEPILKCVPVMVPPDSRTRSTCGTRLSTVLPALPPDPTLNYCLPFVRPTQSPDRYTRSPTEDLL